MHSVEWGSPEARVQLTTIEVSAMTIITEPKKLEGMIWTFGRYINENICIWKLQLSSAV